MRRPIILDDCNACTDCVEVVVAASASISSSTPKLARSSSSSSLFSSSTEVNRNCKFNRPGDDMVESGLLFRLTRTFPGVAHMSGRDGRRPPKFWTGPAGEVVGLLGEASSLEYFFSSRSAFARQRAVGESARSRERAGGPGVERDDGPVLSVMTGSACFFGFTRERFVGDLAAGILGIAFNVRDSHSSSLGGPHTGSASNTSFDPSDSQFLVFLIKAAVGNTPPGAV
mmetsp:Transcript_78743/g.163790  ORF Transcript_78743/g.163790 Transcript_78743/m.163790 type:complete len:228 (-) Transcript_78743:136-819(-)